MSAALLLAAIAFYALDDLLNLSFTLARVGEFNSERSSAYIRYIAPLRLIRDSFDAGTASGWFGHGPGTIFFAKPGYVFHDPTWAKLLYEYGAAGFAAGDPRDALRLLASSRWPIALAGAQLPDARAGHAGPARMAKSGR